MVAKTRSHLLKPLQYKCELPPGDRKESYADDGTNTGDAKDNTSAETHRQLVNGPRHQEFQSFAQKNMTKSVKKPTNLSTSNLYIYNLQPILSIIGI